MTDGEQDAGEWAPLTNAELAQRLIDFGRRVTLFREAAKMSKRKLHTLTGISRSHLDQIEAGQRNLYLTTLGRLVFALRVRPSELLGEHSDRLIPWPDTANSLEGRLGEWVDRVASELWTLRDHQRLTQQTLADDAGTHRTELPEIEQGRRDIKLQTLLRLAHRLNVQPGHILDTVLLG